MSKSGAVLAVIIAVMLVIGLWFLGVAWSKPQGEGEAYRQKNSAENWVKKQKEFQQNYNSIKSQDKQIQVAYDAKKADPTDQRKDINYTGLVNNCISAVGSYNSLAQEYDAKDFKDASLPSEVGTSPETDCKEDVK